MPNRIIKESICTSDSIDQLSWFEEALFYRLIVNCDDYGRFDGRPAIIKNRLFPLKDKVTVKSVEDSMIRMATIGLVVRYEVCGKPYLWLPTWESHQRIRNQKSKYPSPFDNGAAMTVSARKTIDSNPPSIAAVIQSESESNPNPESESESNAPAGAASLPSEREVTAFFETIGRSPLAANIWRRFYMATGWHTADGEDITGLNWKEIARKHEGDIVLVGEVPDDDDVVAAPAFSRARAR